MKKRKVNHQKGRDGQYQWNSKMIKNRKQVLFLTKYPIIINQPAKLALLYKQEYLRKKKQRSNSKSNRVHCIIYFIVSKKPNKIQIETLKIHKKLMKTKTQKNNKRKKVTQKNRKSKGIPLIVQKKTLKKKITNKHFQINKKNWICKSR